MEKIITEKAFSYNIFRLSQVLGKNNKNQLIGFLFDVIKNEKYFDLYNIERNIIDIDDILYFTKKIINLRKSENSIINIANPINIKVFDLVKLIEKITNKKAKYNLIEKEGSFVIDDNYIKSFEATNQIFKENYLENRIKKYYE
jgi:nucleoside-diphosphate-sugar epimerase